MIVGIPIGIALGRQLWTLFARDINALPEPTVPVLSVVRVSVGTILLANIVAAIPGRIATRTSISLNLRAD